MNILNDAMELIGIAAKLTEKPEQPKTEEEMEAEFYESEFDTIY